jgi:hypothetical protein
MDGELSGRDLLLIAGLPARIHLISSRPKPRAHSVRLRDKQRQVRCSASGTKLILNSAARAAGVETGLAGEPLHNVGKLVVGDRAGACPAAPSLKFINQ